MKNRINWGILLWAAFLILITSDCKNLKYLPNLIKELHKLFKKGSGYTEDSGFILIHKSKVKDL
jgi:hypothetical protein